jgi:hypothetical protein
MQRLAARSFLLVASLIIIGNLSHFTIAAQESTPAASPASSALATIPTIGEVIASTTDACDPNVFTADPAGITYQPLDDFGYVIPAEDPAHVLYLTENTLPPLSCILFYRGTFGASTFLVQEGTVEFIAWGGPPLGAPVIWAGNEAGDYVSVPLGAPVTLDAGDWVTVDRSAVAYAYRNPGDEDGKIVMAIYEQTGPRNGCHSACRRNP